MVHIKVSKGLNIPIAGQPVGQPKPLMAGAGTSSITIPQKIGLDLTPFEECKFKILVRVDDRVKLGQPLVEDKDCPGRYFVSPAGGVVREIRRGLKRRLLDIVIEVAQEEEIEKHAPVSTQITRQELIERLKLGGLFTHIRQRPFNFLANPHKTPRNIFVKAVETAPFTPPAEMQVAGYEKEFQQGLDALTKLTDGKVHLVYHSGTDSRAFLEAKGVEKHTVEGPHPAANPSVHLAQIDPIKGVDDVVWTLNAHTVVAIGYLLMHGEYFVPRIISIAGTGVLEGKTGYFKVREGYPINALIAGRVKKGFVRLISGNPLTGHQVESEDYLGYDDTVFCILTENTQREFMHFFRLGTEKYTYSGTYLTGHLNHTDREFDFSTNLHGEHRPFIDSAMSDEVMPLNVSTMHLVKAVLAEDFDTAAELGLLEVDSEDFALPSFVCPSKMEMVDIIKKGLARYAGDVLK
jgi:Na+-transporting NADH:ubiquinone oxidoreductase subunit A